ncbi:hypothetical protein HDU97_004964, partial [Phlyctochytrium planicorne]
NHYGILLYTEANASTVVRLLVEPDYEKKLQPLLRIIVAVRNAIRPGKYQTPESILSSRKSHANMSDEEKMAKLAAQARDLKKYRNVCNIAFQHKGRKLLESIDRAFELDEEESDAIDEMEKQRKIMARDTEKSRHSAKDDSREEEEENDDDSDEYVAQSDDDEYASQYHWEDDTDEESCNSAAELLLKKLKADPRKNKRKWLLLAISKAIADGTLHPDLLLWDFLESQFAFLNRQKSFSGQACRIYSPRLKEFFLEFYLRFGQGPYQMLEGKGFPDDDVHRLPHNWNGDFEKQMGGRRLYVGLASDETDFGSSGVSITKKNGVWKVIGSVNFGGLEQGLQKPILQAVAIESVANLEKAIKEMEAKKKAAVDKLFGGRKAGARDFFEEIDKFVTALNAQHISKKLETAKAELHKKINQIEAKLKSNKNAATITFGEQNSVMRQKAKIVAMETFQSKFADCQELSIMTMGDSQRLKFCNVLAVWVQNMDCDILRKLFHLVIDEAAAEGLTVINVSVDGFSDKLLIDGISEDPRSHPAFVSKV